MGGGNGAKAAQKRERNADKAKKVPSSQLKANEAAKTIVCVLCRQSFLGTMRRPALSTHAEVCIFSLPFLSDIAHETVEQAQQDI
jgi:Small EDRK-rich factor 1/2-like, N-terminal